MPDERFTLPVKTPAQRKIARFVNQPGPSQYRFERPELLGVAQGAVNQFLRTFQSQSIARRVPGYERFLSASEIPSSQAEAVGRQAAGVVGAGEPQSIYDLNALAEGGPLEKLMFAVGGIPPTAHFGPGPNVTALKGVARQGVREAAPAARRFGLNEAGALGKRPAEGSLADLDAQMSKLRQAMTQAKAVGADVSALQDTHDAMNATRLNIIEKNLGPEKFARFQAVSDQLAQAQDELAAAKEKQGFIPAPKFGTPERAEYDNARRLANEQGRSPNAKSYLVASAQRKMTVLKAEHDALLKDAYAGEMIQGAPPAEMAPRTSAQTGLPGMGVEAAQGRMMSEFQATAQESVPLIDQEALLAKEANKPLPGQAGMNLTESKPRPEPAQAGVKPVIPQAASVKVAPTEVKPPITPGGEPSSELGGIQRPAEFPEAQAAAGGQPPVPPKPPAPPVPPSGAVPPGGKVPPPKGQELVRALVKRIREAKPARELMEAEVTKELGRRAAISKAALAKGNRGLARGAFAGELPKPADMTPAAAAFTPEEGQALRGMIDETFREAPFKWIQADTAFTKLFDNGQLPTRSELVVLEEVFGKEFTQAIIDKRKLGAKAWELFLEGWNVPRAMLAGGGDMSATLNQAALFMFTNKGETFREAFKAQIRAYAKEENALASAQRIANHPLYAESQRAGLDLTVPSTIRTAAPIASREEAYVGARLAAKIPLFGKLVQMSERGYVTMLNETRFGVFAREMEALGPNHTTADAKAVANVINILTGRGNLGKANEASTILNGVFFSPRNAVSRFQVPATVLLGKSVSRKLAARSLVSYATTTLTMLALADLSGVASVVWDPRSSDFGKFRIGNVRVDPWVGLQQPVVLVTRLLSGQQVNRSTGLMDKIDPKDAVASFVETKLHPSITTLEALRRGQFFGKEGVFSTENVPYVPNIIYKTLTPLFIQDIIDAIHSEGPAGVSYGPITFLGERMQAGVDVYEKTNYDFSRIPGVKDLDLQLGKVGDSIDLTPGTKGGSFQLTPAQQSKYQQLMADMVIPAVGEFASKERVRSLPDAKRKEAIQTYMSALRDRARSKAIQTIIVPARKAAMTPTPTPLAIRQQQRQGGMQTPAPTIDPRLERLRAMYPQQRQAVAP